MKYRTLKFLPSQKRGVTLLIAVLVASVVLAVGIGVYQRTYKELYFSSFWKQTQVAATAADSGLECALYWELHPPTLVTDPIYCFGSQVWPINWEPGQGLPGAFTKDTGNGCVEVKVTHPGSPGTHIESRGYNDACVLGNVPTNLRTVERGLYFEY